MNQENKKNALLHHRLLHSIENKNETIVTGIKGHLRHNENEREGEKGKDSHLSHMHCRIDRRTLGIDESERVYRDRGIG